MVEEEYLDDHNFMCEFCMWACGCGDVDLRERSYRVLYSVNLVVGLSNSSNEQNYHFGCWSYSNPRLSTTVYRSMNESITVTNSKCFVNLGWELAPLPKRLRSDGLGGWSSHTVGRVNGRLHQEDKKRHKIVKSRD